MSDSNDITTRVHDAIHMNVDFMDGPPRIVERALEVAGQVRRRRRRRRALAGALLVTATVGTLAGVAVATRDEHGGITVTAGSSTTHSPATTIALPDPGALIAHWNTACGVAPKFAPIAGLRFTLELESTVVQPGASARPTIVLENTTDHEVGFDTGNGTWYVTNPAGLVVGTSAGYGRYAGPGYMVRIPAYSIVRRPSTLSGHFEASSGSCSGSGLDPPPAMPLEPGRYLAWFALPHSSDGTNFLSEPVPFEVPQAPAWDVKVTRDQAVAIGRATAIDPTTAIVTAKLASWGEIRDAGAAVGRSPSDEPDRRVWVVSVAGPVRSRCCLTPHAPFRWGVVFIDASTGDAFAFNQGSTGDVAPWFADLPDHGR